MTERVVSVNVGGVREVPHAGGTVRTGIFKSPVRGAVHLGPEGLAGDGQADLSVHGGVDMAAYLYSADDYAWWSARLGRPLEPGTFGENLTVTGLHDAEVLVGDVLRIGGAIAQVTAPRIPCFKLGIRMGDKRFVPQFRDAARLGFYVRTLEEGVIAAGDTVEVLQRGTPGVTITEIARLHMHAEDDLDGLRAALAARDHLHARWATWVEDRVAALTRTGG